MKRFLLEILFTVLIGLLSSVAAFAQDAKNIKPIPRKATPRQIDPKKLFDPQKMGNAMSLTDLGIKGAELSWADYGTTGFVLDVIPVLTKNSKTAKIYALGKDGKVAPLTFTVEALDANDKTVEVCTQTLLGWTVEETETEYPVCTFHQATWKKADRFRITADAKKLLNETNTGNNVVVVKKTEFTSKEYSTMVAPL